MRNLLLVAGVLMLIGGLSGRECGSVVANE